MNLKSIRRGVAYLITEVFIFIPRPFFYPLNRQPIVNKYGFADENCKNAFMMYKQGLYLPSGLNLSIDQVNDVCDNLIITLKEIILL